MPLSSEELCALDAHDDRSRRWRLAAVIVVWGIQALVLQALLLREATVLMYGSEFAWGVVLSAWLAGVALGGVAGGRLAERVQVHAALALCLVLLALPVVAGLDLWAFRGARAWLGVGPGELLPLPRLALAGIVLVTPVGLLVGAAFPLACAGGGAQTISLCDERESGARGQRSNTSATADAEPGRCTAARGAGRCDAALSLGRVYALEALGSLVGGAAFSFWAVGRFPPSQLVALCGVLTAAACLARLAAHRRARVFAAGMLMLFLVGAAAGPTLEARLLELRWRNTAPGYDLVASAESKYQHLAVGRRVGQYTLYCDGHVAADFPDPYTYVPLTHFWLCQHPQPRRVLLIGGGAEGLLAEILRHPLEHVDYVETDARQLELIAPFLTDADRAALADPRVTVHHADARYFVKTRPAQFDLVLARLPEPTTALRARLYTAEFFTELRRALTADAVVCLTAAATPTNLSPAARAYLGTLRATLRTALPEVLVSWGDPAYIFAATRPGLLTTDPAELAARYERRGVAAPLFDPAWFEGATDWLTPDKVTARRAELDAAAAARVHSDWRSTLLMQRLALWEAATGRTQVVAWLSALRVRDVALSIGVVALLTLVLPRLRHGADAGWVRGALLYSVASTGFATMALSILWLFAFQNLYGFVYQRIGWIVALFMGGLVLGCLLVPAAAMGPRSARSGASRSPGVAWLALVDAMLAGLAFAVPHTLRWLAGLEAGVAALTIVEVTISTLVALTGLLGGAAFALAGQAQLGLTPRAGAAAGVIVGADHAGACLGALVCGVLLVPVFGLANTAWLLAGVKAVAAVALAWSGMLRGISKTGS
jgi:spermidine synthase